VGTLDVLCMGDGIHIMTAIPLVLRTHLRFVQADISSSQHSPPFLPKRARR
jgi:hypothetical protein